MNTAGTWPVLMLVAVLSIAPLWTQGTQDDTELAKQTQNPVADLISVPLQNNFNFGAGPKDATIYVLNVQPVIPLRLTQDWNLITRIITPVINQPSLFEGGESAFGLGDINPTFFLSPAKPGELIWGVGPTFTLPTATAHAPKRGGPEIAWFSGPAMVGTVRLDGGRFELLHTFVVPGYENLTVKPERMRQLVADLDGANLDRIQIIKGWLDGKDELHERIFDVAVSNGRKNDADGQCKTPVGNTVDVPNASYKNTIGDALLMGRWKDPAFNP
jgi:hypothetical protein